MRLLLVEDEPDAARVLAKGLREHAYAVDLAGDGDTALCLLGTTDYDAVILDVMLPLKDGFEVCRGVRASGSSVPILMLTARDTVDARIQGLDCGADDYLIKPFDFAELLARLRALLRRGRHHVLPPRIPLGRLLVDTRGRRAWMDSRELSLTAKEYALLEYLARRAGEVVSRGDLAEHVWKTHDDLISNTIDVYIQRLRHKLGQTGPDSIIQTRRGKGYQLIADLASLDRRT